MQLLLSAASGLMVCFLVSVVQANRLIHHTAYVRDRGVWGAEDSRISKYDIIWVRIIPGNAVELWEILASASRLNALSEDDIKNISKVYRQVLENPHRQRACQFRSFPRCV